MDAGYIRNPQDHSNSLAPPSSEHIFTCYPTRNRIPQGIPTAGRQSQVTNSSWLGYRTRDVAPSSPGRLISFLTSSCYSCSKLRTALSIFHFLIFQECIQRRNANLIPNGEKTCLLESKSKDDEIKILWTLWRATCGFHSRPNAI